MQLMFYISYIVGFVLATGFSVRYATLTRGAWREHPAGISIMGMSVSLAVVMFAVTIRVVFLRMLNWSWADTPTVVLAQLGIWLVIGWIAHRWYLLERYQKSDKE
jgi:hypothetical protein